MLPWTVTCANSYCAQDSRRATSTIEIKQFPGGHSNLTYLIRYGDREFVLRRPPVGPVAPTAHDMPREYKLLSVINPHFPLAPKTCAALRRHFNHWRAVLFDGATSWIDRRHEIPNQIGENLDLRRRVSESVVDTLAALHAVDIQASGIVQIGKPAGFVTRQVNGWADRWQRVRRLQSSARWSR